MRSLFAKVLISTALLATVFGVHMSSATAQQYPPLLPSPVDCSSLPAPQVTIDGTVVVVTFPPGSLTCIIRVVVEVNPVLYDGPAPASGVLRLPVPALSGAHTATVTATYVDGTSASASLPVPEAALAAARTAFVAAGGVLSVPVTTQSIAVGDLAFTGSSTNVPMALGAGLIGAGGLALLAARKRRLHG